MSRDYRTVYINKLIFIYLILLNQKIIIYRKAVGRNKK